MQVKLNPDFITEAANRVYYDPAAERREAIGMMVFALLCIPIYAGLIIWPLFLATCVSFGRSAFSYSPWLLLVLLVLAAVILIVFVLLFLFVLFRTKRLEMVNGKLIVTYAVGCTFRNRAQAQFLFSGYIVDFADEQHWGCGCKVFHSGALPFVVADTMREQGVVSPINPKVPESNNPKQT